MEEEEWSSHPMRCSGSEAMTGARTGHDLNVLASGAGSAAARAWWSSVRWRLGSPGPLPLLPRPRRRPRPFPFSLPLFCRGCMSNADPPRVGVLTGSEVYCAVR